MCWSENITLKISTWTVWWHIRFRTKFEYDSWRRINDHIKCITSLMFSFVDNQNLKINMLTLIITWIYLSTFFILVRQRTFWCLKSNFILTEKMNYCLRQCIKSEVYLFQTFIIDEIYKMLTISSSSCW